MNVFNDFEYQFDKLLVFFNKSLKSKNFLYNKKKDLKSNKFNLIMLVFFNFILIMSK